MTWAARARAPRGRRAVSTGARRASLSREISCAGSCSAVPCRPSLRPPWTGWGCSHVGHACTFSSPLSFHCGRCWCCSRRAMPTRTSWSSGTGCSAQCQPVATTAASRSAPRPRFLQPTESRRMLRMVGSQGSPLGQVNPQPTSSGAARESGDHPEHGSAHTYSGNRRHARDYAGLCPVTLRLQRHRLRPRRASHHGRAVRDAGSSPTLSSESPRTPRRRRAVCSRTPAAQPRT